MSDVDAWAGPWKLSGEYPNRKLTRVDSVGEVREWLFEMDGNDTVFKEKMRNIQQEHGKFSIHKPGEPAVEKTTTTVTEVHSIRLASNHSICHGPFDTAADALLCAGLINAGGALDEGEWYQVITTKTTVEVTIL